MTGFEKKLPLQGVSTEKKLPRPVERSKSFSIKCDKGYATYYQIEPKKTCSEMRCYTVCFHILL